MKIFLVLIFAGWGAFSATSGVQGQATEGVTIYVNGQSAKASDTNPGTEALPLKTLNRAAVLMLQNNKLHKGTKVLIAAGTYRERVIIPPDAQETAAPLTFEALGNGKVVISGSDVWTGWERQGTSAVYAHAWPYKWGLASYPAGWEGNVVLQPIVRRREMIFVNGTLLEQVLTSTELRPGSFLVDETGGKVQLWPPAGINLETASVEVAVRSEILKVTTKHNVTVKGLTFMHDNTPVQGSAVTIDSGSNIVLEDNQFMHNNWGGLALYNITGATLRRNVATHNGVVGIDVWRVKKLVAEANDTSYNNWRGAKGGFYGWTAAGMKNMFLHSGVFRKHRSVSNQTRGLWFDTDCTDIVIEDAFLGENFGDGIFLEAVQGPISIKGSTICHNQKTAGVFVANTTNATFENNTVYGNRDTQILVSGEYEGSRSVKNWETGETLQLKSERWTLKNNVVVGVASGSSVLRTTLSPTLWNLFVSTLTSNGNVWFNADQTAVFEVANATLLDLPQWRVVAAQDVNSVFADPQFVNPAQHDFNLRPSSPLRNMSGWLTLPAPPDSLYVQ